ncbi:hypothetical protein ACFWP3_03220 [Streptomyces sp. NPDC058525]|uniref:hypothetical protein n=1 Tax=unclassified Streptomyces TaxID=2593676 RepID=UPI00364DE43E
MSSTSFRAGRCAVTAALAVAVLMPLHAAVADGPAAGTARPAHTADLAEGAGPGTGTGTGNDDFIWNIAPKPAPAPGAAAHA